MARQSKLTLREGATDDIVKDWPPGTFPETGAGTGYMTRKFLELGYTGACYELGVAARAQIRGSLASYDERIFIADSLQELEGKTFDCLLSFEVLEHIDDDLGALQQWTRHLKPGGQLLISVSAHARKFGKSDELVGHLRRYEREDVQRLLSGAGYRDIEMINYGFPLSEMTRPIANVPARRGEDVERASPQELSMRSSHSRQSHIRKIINTVGERPIAPFLSLQRLFCGCDWGDGIIATAVRG